MTKGSILGEFEQTVLFTLARLDGAATGREVYTELLAVTGRDASIASVHVTLTRLEEKGFLKAKLAPGPEGLGKEVKQFALNRAGLHMLRECRAHWDQLWDGVDLEAGKAGS